ncbi:MAG: hypothetical protein WC501_02060 [Candidatus Micrarchaeia archaeon]
MGKNKIIAGPNTTTTDKKFPAGEIKNKNLEKILDFVNSLDFKSFYFREIGFSYTYIANPAPERKEEMLKLLKDPHTQEMVKSIDVDKLIRDSNKFCEELDGLEEARAIILWFRLKGIEFGEVEKKAVKIYYDSLYNTQLNKIKEARKIEEVGKEVEEKIKENIKLELQSSLRFIMGESFYHSIDVGPSGITILQTLKKIEDCGYDNAPDELKENIIFDLLSCKYNTDLEHLKLDLRRIINHAKDNPEIWEAAGIHGREVLVDLDGLFSWLIVSSLTKEIKNNLEKWKNSDEEQKKEMLDAWASLISKKFES